MELLLFFNFFHSLNDQELNSITEYCYIVEEEQSLLCYSLERYFIFEDYEIEILIGL